MEYSSYQASQAQLKAGLDYASSLDLDTLKQANTDLSTTLTQAQTAYQTGVEALGFESSSFATKIASHIATLEKGKEAFEKGVEVAGGVEVAVKGAQKVAGKVIQSASEMAGKMASKTPAELGDVELQSTAIENVSAEATTEIADVAGETGVEMAGVGESAVAETAELGASEIAEGGAVAIGESASMMSGLAVAEGVASASVVLEPLALVGGAVMLGMTIADGLKASSREKKEEKKSKKEIEAQSVEQEKQYNQQQSTAQKSYDDKVAEIKASANKLKNGILANAHLSVSGGHTNLRNR